MTIVFAIVAALVFGALLFLLVRRRIKRQEKKKSLEHTIIACPKCKVLLNAAAVWTRSGLRGDFCKCNKCGYTSIWDFEMEAPVNKK